MQLSPTLSPGRLRVRWGAISPRPADCEDLNQDYARHEAADVRPVGDTAAARTAGAEVHPERREAVEGLQDEPVAENDPRGQGDRDEDDAEEDQVAHAPARLEDDIAAKDAGDGAARADR